MGFWDSISSGFSSAWNSVKSFSSKVVTGIGDAGKSVFNWGKTNIPKAAQTVVKSTKDFYNNEVKPAVTTVYNDTVGNVKNLVAGVSSLEKGAGNFLSNGFTPIAIGLVAVVALIMIK